MGDNYYYLFTPEEIVALELDFHDDVSTPWDWPVEEEPLVADCD